VTRLGALTLAVLGLLAAGCGATTVVERVRMPETVIVTAEVPYQEVTVEVTREVTLVVTRVKHATVIVTATPLPAPAALSDAAALQAAMRWLIGRQQLDGGFGSVGDTAWAIMALAAAGIDPEDMVNQPGRNPLAYMNRVIEQNLVTRAETTALAALALAAAGQEVPEQLNLAERRPTTWPALPLVVLALGDQAPDELVEALVETQEEDGGSFGGVADTAWAVMAMVAAGHEDTLPAALGFLHDCQRWDGSWPSDRRGDPDPGATALAIQALMAAGQDLEDWHDPLHALLDLQQSDGSFADDLPTTTAAVIALHKTWLGGLAH
jgi:hypothetical protein